MTLLDHARIWRNKILISNESENKNNVASCLWSISDRTNASTEKIYASYESPNTQLLWAWGTRAWHTHGFPRSHPLNHEKVFVWNASIWVGGPCNLVSIIFNQACIFFQIFTRSKNTLPVRATSGCYLKSISKEKIILVHP